MVSSICDNLVFYKHVVGGILREFSPNKSKDPAEFYIQRAFEISLNDELENTARMYRCLWATLHQKTVKQRLASKPKVLKEIKKKLQVIETRPSCNIEIGLYDLCYAYGLTKLNKDISAIRIRDRRTHLVERYSPAEFAKELRNVMDELSIICGELAVYAGMELTLPGTITTEGV